MMKPYFKATDIVMNWHEGTECEQAPLMFDTAHCGFFDASHLSPCFPLICDTLHCGVGLGVARPAHAITVTYQALTKYNMSYM